ncbi:MAG: hypothetical protein ACSLE0_12535 [Chitinophagaceae bacterium]
MDIHILDVHGQIMQRVPGIDPVGAYKVMPAMGGDPSIGVKKVSLSHQTVNLLFVD